MYAGNANDARAKEYFEKASAKFQITKLHEHGLYRHYRCGEPGNCANSFQVMAWPGFLAFVGDMGDYVFSRTDDMIAFMARAARDCSYSAEKCVASGRGGLTEWSYARFDAWCNERLAEHPDYESKEAERVQDAVDEIRAAYQEYNEPHDALRTIWHHAPDLGVDEMPNFEEYTVHFLWCLHALQWFCANVPAADLHPQETT